MINYLFLLIPTCILCLQLLMSTVNPQQEGTQAHGHDERPMDDHKWVKRADIRLPMSPEKAGRLATQRQHHADQRPISAPECAMRVVACGEVSSFDEALTDNHEGAQMPTEETQEGDVRKLQEEVLSVKKREEIDARRDAATSQGHLC